MGGDAADVDNAGVLLAGVGLDVVSQGLHHEAVPRHIHPAEGVRAHRTQTKTHKRSIISPHSTAVEDQLDSSKMMKKLLCYGRLQIWEATKL